MPFQINGYDNLFRSFTDFAREQIQAGDKKAVAIVHAETGLGGRTILSVRASLSDSVHGALTRTRVEQTLNERARTAFFNAVGNMFGGRNRIPPAVIEALQLDDFGQGKPLSARRIVKVQKAVDEALLARQKETNERLSSFVSAEVRTAALDLGFTKAELPRLALAAHFLAESEGIDEMAAMQEVARPGSAANRLMNYGGRFLDNAATFARGLRLLDSFADWFADLCTRGGDETVSKINVFTDAAKPRSLRPMEKFVFEELASNPAHDLSGDDAEKLFGFEHNAASRFVGRGFAASSLYSLREMPADKRQLLYKTFDLFCGLPKTSEEREACRGPGKATWFSTFHCATVSARVRRHFAELEALQAKGRFTPENVLKAIFPEMTRSQRGACDSKAVDAYLDRLAVELSLDADEGGEYADVGGGVQLVMERTGCTPDEAAESLRTGKSVSLPRWTVDASTNLFDMDGTTASARKLMEGDLYRPSNYRQDGQNLLPAGAGFGFSFPGGGGRIQTDSSEEGRANIPRVSAEIERLCGAAHPEQTSSVMLMLSQSGMGNLRDGIPAFGVRCEEHAAVEYSLSRDAESGAVTIRYESPEGLPFRFSWTATVATDGSISSTPAVFEKPVQFDNAAARKAASAAAKSLGFKLDRAQTARAAAILEQHAGGMYPENARLFARFVVQLVHAGKRSAETQAADFAPQIKEWRNVRGGDPAMKRVEETFAGALRDMATSFLAKESNFGGKDLEKDIHGTMIQDAHRADYVINGRAIPRDGEPEQTRKAVISAFKEAVPPKAHRMLSSLMQQASFDCFVRHSQNFPLDFGNTLIGDLPGGNRLVHRGFANAMAAGCQMAVMMQQTHMTYALDVAEDGRSAVLTISSATQLTAERKENEKLFFGTVRQSQRVEIDLSGDVPQIGRVEVSQTFGE